MDKMTLFHTPHL